MASYSHTVLSALFLEDTITKITVKDFIFKVLVFPNKLFKIYKF